MSGRGDMELLTKILHDDRKTPFLAQDLLELGLVKTRLTRGEGVVLLEGRPWSFFFSGPHTCGI